VISRNDQFYMCPHNLSELDSNYLWVPKGENYGGICDRHLVVNASHVLQALDVLPPLLDTPQRYKDLLNYSFGNSERYVKLRLKEQYLFQRVRRFNRNMFLCAAGGDTNLFAPMEQRTPQGVHVRYPTEYNASLETCHAAVMTAGSNATV
jgi:hypothetical protein